MALNLKPLADRLVVEPIEGEEITASGIYVPDTAKEKPQEGKVLAVGPGRKDEDGDRIAMDVAEGDRVLYAQYAGTEVTCHGARITQLELSEGVKRNGKTTYLFRKRTTRPQGRRG
jgi:chaperonin GroES